MESHMSLKLATLLVSMVLLATLAEAAPSGFEQHSAFQNLGERIKIKAAAASVKSRLHEQRK
jgi:hypothetical protein